VTVTQVSRAGALAPRTWTFRGAASAAQQLTKRRATYHLPSSSFVTKPVSRRVRPFMEAPLSHCARDANAFSVSSTGSPAGSSGKVPTPCAATFASSRSALYEPRAGGG
jgi:hypothetical protein